VPRPSRVDDAHAETQRQAAEHAAALAERTGQLTTAQHALAQYQRELRTGLTRLLRSSATPAAGLDPTEALEQAHAAERDLRHGVEDLLRELELDS
jgi:hypothetical protein